MCSAKIRSVDTGKTGAEKRAERWQKAFEDPSAADSVSSGCQHSVGCRKFGTGAEEGGHKLPASADGFSGPMGSYLEPTGCWEISKGHRRPAAEPAPHMVIVSAGRFCIGASRLPFGSRGFLGILGFTWKARDCRPSPLTGQEPLCPLLAMQKAPVADGTGREDRS